MFSLPVPMAGAGLKPSDLGMREQVLYQYATTAGQLQY